MLKTEVGFSCKSSEWDSRTAVPLCAAARAQKQATAKTVSSKTRSQFLQMLIIDLEF